MQVVIDSANTLLKDPKADPITKLNSLRVFIIFFINRINNCFHHHISY